MDMRPSGEPSAGVSLASGVILTSNVPVARVVTLNSFPVVVASLFVLEDERDLHQHAVFRDLALVDHDFLALDPRAGESTERLVSACDADVDCVLEALGRGGMRGSVK